MAFRGYFSSTSETSNDTSSSGNLEVIKFEGRNLRLTKQIAEGGFSYVYLGDFGGQMVAVKKMLTPDKKAVQEVGDEMELLSRLDHRNIVKLLGVKTSNVENYIVMEYCCPLPKTEGNEPLVGNVFRQCCSAVEYMHNLGIAHRDVKLENFLIGADGFVKLVDFGSASREIIRPNLDWNATQRGIVEESVAEKTTPMYRAPELLDLWLNYQIDTRVDLWALGCLLYLLNYGTHPFPDSNKLAIINSKYVMKNEDAFTAVIRGLLQPNPDERWGFELVLDHLSSFSISKLEFRKPAAVVVQETSKREEKSLFSSLRGGAESLFKNIKENIREMTAELPSAIPPPRPAEPPSIPPPGNDQGHGHGVPPPRPPKPPAPATTMRQPASMPPQQEFSDIPPRVNRHSPLEDELMSASMDEELLGSKEPSLPEPVRNEAIDVLLDFGDSPPTATPAQVPAPGNLNGPSVDLLADLFGTTTTLNPSVPSLQPQMQSVPQMQSQSIPKMQPQMQPMQSNSSSVPQSFNSVPPSAPQGKNLLDDLDLFGNDITSTIPSSSSFSSLTQLKPERIVKNVSTPNLTDLITEKEKPSAAAPSFAQPNNRPNYSRTAFEPQEKQDPQKKNNLNDVFGEFLKSEGFNVAPSSKNQTIQEMRRQDMATSGMDPITLKISAWTEGKKKNIRALLSSLHTITWPDCNWEEISMAQMITPAQVKKAYRKACLAIHPDKQVGSEHEALAKSIFVELNEAWTGFEEIK